MSSKRVGESSQSEVTTKKSRCESEFALNSDLCDDSFKDLVKEWFTTDKGDTVVKQGQLITNPFQCCSIQNFFEVQEGQLEQLEETLLGLEMNPKNNDLYKFSQSDDLKSLTTPILVALKNFMCGPFRDWMMDVTGIQLNDTVDISCSMYKQTDVLLCHDDELKGRRIAFVFYLVQDWLPEDGGALDLFVCGADGQPKSIVKSLLPTRNSLVFFEVTPASFHQVSEILSDKTRLSVNGWFHGAPVKRPPPHIFPLPALEPPGFVEETMLYEWINASYLDMENWGAIQKQFEEASEIQLENFLTTEKYEEVSKALSQCSFSTSSCGPANLRHYQRIEEDKIPEILSECRKVLTSEAMLLCLSHMTGLKLHRLAQKDEDQEETSEKECGKCACEIRNWCSGNYTLVHDNDSFNQGYGLDARLTFNCGHWSPEMGGYVSYIARDVDEELITVNPEPNALAIVYRDAETVKFIKHVNSKCHQPFQDIAVTYYE